MPHPNVLPKCPYYVRENQITIFCESEAAVRLRLNTENEDEREVERVYAHIFRSAREKTVYMRKHCQEYPDMNCPYADYLNRIYKSSI